MVISLAANSKGTAVLSGHEDCSIIRFYLVEEHGDVSGKILTHSMPPFVIAWPQNFICVAGSDKKIFFYDNMVSSDFF